MLFTIFSALNAQNSMNMSELSNWDNDSLPGHTYGTFNDVWGYADSEEREYAIMGSASYIHFINVSDPANPVLIDPFLGGYYDTYPSNTEYNGYAGCWGVYPYLPSGNILASDMSNGLFVLEFDESVKTNQLPDNISSFEIFPNPNEGTFKIELSSQTQTSMRLSLTTLTGQLVKEKVVSFNGKYDDWLDISDLPSGMYFLSSRR